MVAKVTAKEKNIYRSREEKKKMLVERGGETRTANTNRKKMSCEQKSPSAGAGARNTAVIQFSRFFCAFDFCVSKLYFEKIEQQPTGRLRKCS